MSDEPRNSKNAEHGEHAEHAEAGADPAVSVVGPGDGETILLGTTRMRVLEDGSHTGHRLGMAESVLAPHTPDRPSTVTPGTTRASTSSPARCGSPWGTRTSTRRRARS